MKGMGVYRPCERTLRFGYTNWRGEYAVRTATPRSFHFGETEHHEYPYWVMRAFCHDRNAIRLFALKDCDFTVGFPGEAKDE